MGEPPSTPPDTLDHDGDDAPRAPRRSRHQLRLPTEITRMDAPDETPPKSDASTTVPDGATVTAAPQGERPSVASEVEVHFDMTGTVSVPPMAIRTPPPDGPTGSMVVVRRKVRMIGQDDSANAAPATPAPAPFPDPSVRISSPPLPRIAEPPAEPAAPPPSVSAGPSSPPPTMSFDGDDLGARSTIPMGEAARKVPSNPPLPRVEDAIPKRPSTPPPSRRPSNPPPPMIPAGSTASAPPPAAPVSIPAPAQPAPAPAPVSVPAPAPASASAPPAVVVSTPAPAPAVATPVSMPPLPISGSPSMKPPPLPQVSLGGEESVVEIDRISAPPDDDSVEVSLDEAAPSAVVVPALPKSKPSDAHVDPSLAMLDELAEMSTETHEIDPDAIEPVEPVARGTSLPPPPPKDVPRPPTKSSVPPVTTKITGHVTVPDTRPKRRRMWWEEVFNEDYFRIMERLSPSQAQSEADWIEHALGVEAGASILDVGCGSGRQAVELAKRRYEVMGVDLSVAMLTRAAEAAQERGASVAFTQCDMAAMEFTEGYDAAYCVGSSFGFFDDARNAEVARRIHKALKPHGTFLLAVLNRDHTIQRQPAMAWFEGDGCVCMEESSFNFITSRLNVKRTMIFDDGRQREFEYSIRLYSLHELGQVLHEAGFRILEVSGQARTPGAFFGPTSRELIILAQKRAPEVVDLPGEAGDSSRPV